jgi:hypothetical protein
MPVRESRLCKIRHGFGGEGQFVIGCVLAQPMQMIDDLGIRIVNARAGGIRGVALRLTAVPWRSVVRTFHAVLPMWMRATIGRPPRSARSERDPPGCARG